MSMICAKKKAETVAPALVIDNLTLPLKHFPYIYNQICFKKHQAKVQVLLNSGSELNFLTLAYIATLDQKFIIGDVGA